jgi:exosortase
MLFAILWLDLLRLLSHTWDAREQYAYGWFVPIFSLYFFWARASDKPGEGARRGYGWMFGLALIAIVALLPLRVILEINADWPLMVWPYVLFIVWISLHAAYLAGGFPWFRHFLFPIAFICVAVAWPERIEKGLVQDLMQVVARITVAVLEILEIPALQRGNLIEISSGVVGIDEACSGIRSLQSTFMCSLLMGELYRLRFWLRLGLVASGAVLAFVFNIVRTTLLTWQASTAGLGTLTQSHDSTGITITVACLLALWLVAWEMRRRWPSAGALIEHQVDIQLPRRFLLAVGCYGVGLIVITELWYRSHETKSFGGFHWTAVLPTNNPSFKPVELTPRVVKLMGHDVGSAGSWTESDGSEWSAYFFRWNPRSISSVMLSRAHRPDVCLPASGMNKVADAGLAYLGAGSLKLPFRQYTYEADGQPFHVFFCQWEDGDVRQAGMGASKRGDRLQSVLTGRRLLGQQTLEVVIAGHDTIDEAAEAMRRYLPSLIRAEASSSPDGD